MIPPQRSSRGPSIIVLQPFPGIQGPLPVLVSLLVTALRDAGCEVDTENWGRHHDEENLMDKLFGRTVDLCRIAFRLVRRKYDICFAVSSHDWTALSRDIPLLLAAGILARKSILHIHGSDIDKLEDRRSRLFRAATRLLFGLCDGVIVSSHFEREGLSKGARNCPVFVADNIYTSTPLSEEPGLPEWHLPNDRPIVLCAARFIPEKGILELVEAMPSVLQSCPCHLLLAGVGPLEGRVRERIFQLGIQDHVSMVGYLNRDEIKIAYSRATVFALPTYHREGFPHVIQDALGHGLPIVTSPIRGVFDHLQDGVHALFAPPQNPGILADKIKTLLSDPGLRERMGTANKCKIKDFDSKLVVQQYLEIFEKVLGPDRR